MQGEASEEEEIGCKVHDPKVYLPTGFLHIETFE